VQDARMPMILAAVSYWVIGVPVSYVLGFALGFGAIGIWAGLVIGLAAASGLLMARFWRREWQVPDRPQSGVLA
jgi:multidrug resistance protein, MATE family